LAEPLAIRALRDRLNHTYNGLSGQPTAIVATLPSPPPVRYLHPSTARGRLNYTLNGLAIGLESVQPTAIAIATAIATIPPRTQTPTPIILQPPIESPPQLPPPPATPIAAPATPTTPPGPSA